MRAAMVTSIQVMPTATNGVEPAGEAVAAVQGMRINTAPQSQTTETLFTKILQKGIAVNNPVTALGLGSGEMPVIASAEDEKKTGQEDSADVCSLLMQMLVMHSAVQTADGGATEKTDETTINGVLGAIGESSETGSDSAQKGLLNAASVILQNDGKAAEVLTALADAKTGQPEAGQAEGSFKKVLDGISDALRSELEQNSALQDVQANVTKVASTSEKPAAEGLVSNTANVPAAKGSDIQALKNEKTRAAGRTEELLRADSAASADGAAGNQKVGKPSDSQNAGDSKDTGTKDGESLLSKIVSQEKSKNDETGAAGNSGLSGMLSGVKAETAAEKTAAVERALNRFADDLRNVQGGSQEIKIVLEPESLGVLTISVVKTENGISAKIKSEDKDVAAIISDQVHKLISSMESKGITVSEVDVTYSQAEQNMGFAQHSFSQARDESSRRYSQQPVKGFDEEASNTDIWQTLYSGETSGDTSVDYRI